MIAIRKANLRDTEVVAKMIYEVYQILFPDFAEHSFEKYLAVTPQFIQSNVNDLYVAVDNTVVYGYMFGQLSDGICLTKPVYTVQQLYVLEEYRSLGAATALFAFAKELVKKHKAELNVITSDSDITNRAVSKMPHRVEGTIIRILN